MKIFEFLTKCRNLINMKTTEQITLVVGNQSADLDSIISAITFAYYKFKKLNKISYFPVLNTTVEIIESKDECNYYFDYHKINKKDFIYLNEFKNGINSNVSIFLVDHNKLDDFEISLNVQELITGVVDHHKDEENFFREGSDIRLIDNTIASNSLLITEIISNENLIEHIDESLFTSLLFAVLADTNNMSPNRPRITDRDQILFDYLVGKSCLNLDQVNSIYNKINDLKVNSSKNKSIDEILKNDYKQWSININEIKYGISSVIIEPKQWIEKETRTKFIDQVLTYKKSNNLNFFLILAVFHDHESKIYRDLLLFGDRTISDDFLTRMNNEVNIHENFQVNDDTVIGLWMKTLDGNKTRKIWQPLIDEYLIWKLKGEIND
jgi:exopolyphosphatase